MPPAPSDWPHHIHRTLQQLGVRQVAYVPDAGHSILIRACQDDAAMTTVALTTEEEGVALLAGAWLGGQRGVLLLQSSGVGNCVNMLSLVKNCRFPMLMLVTMRGQWGETNPWQIPMGQITAEALRLAGLAVHEVEDAAAVAGAVAAAGQMAYASQTGAAVLIGQRLIGAKVFLEGQGGGT